MLRFFDSLVLTSGLSILQSFGPLILLSFDPSNLQPLDQMRMEEAREDKNH